ncbi:MAG: DUF2807 domain-containing protein [Salinivirgaceae bacterium]|jgi:hypothetical protein|nr:DUF2807 domain-containing protein [Salinivirgaceae bacterium]
MKKIVVFTIVGLAVLSLFAAKNPPVLGSSTVVTEEREIVDFNAVSVSHGIDLHLTQSNSIALKVEADEHVISHLITEVKGDRLNIYIDGKVTNIEVLNVYLSYKHLNRLIGSSGADIITENIMESDDLEVDISSGCDLQIEIKGHRASFDVRSGADAYVAFEGKKLVVDASSGATVNLKADELDNATFTLSSGATINADGSAAEVDVETSSGSTFSGYELVGVNVSAKAFSASSIQVTVVGDLHARASDVGSVYYKGKVDNCYIKENTLGTVSKR